MKKEKKYDLIISSRFFKEIHIINNLDDIKEVEMILQSIEIDIDNIIWNYQDWILKILESLKDAEFISKYDYNSNWVEFKRLSDLNDELNEKDWVIEINLF